MQCIYLNRALAAICFVALIPVANAQTIQTLRSDQQTLNEPFQDIETKYIFGFTQGSDIGNEGEKAIEFETNGSFQKRGGRYSAIEQEVEFESVPSQFFAYELSTHGMAHSISSVEGLNNINRIQFSGLSANLEYLVVGRGPGAPVGLAISAEPEWSRVDATDGTKTRDYSSTFRTMADTELIANRLYAAFNLIYVPEVSKGVEDVSWQRSSFGAASVALAYRVTPQIILGVGTEYDRAYEGLAFQTFDGEALFVGPSLYVQITPKCFVAAAFSGQVTGHAQGDPRLYDLTDFERYRGRLKMEIEF